MNKLSSFAAGQITAIEAHLAWASLEILTDDVEELQVMVAGDDHDVQDFKVEEKEGRLLLEQPTYGLSMKLNTERWMQVLLRLPRAWRGSLSADTITAPLRVRGVQGTDIALATVSGDLRAASLGGITLALRTISGAIGAQQLRAEQLGARTVSGRVTLEGLACDSCRLGGVSGDMRLNFDRPFARLDATTVSGDVEINAPMDQADVALRAVSGRLRTSGVSLGEGGPQIRCASVSGDLAVHCAPMGETIQRTEE